MSGTQRRSMLDGPAARVVAVLIALSGIAFLGWIHRKDIFPADPGAAESADPRRAAFNACYEPQAARIDKDLASGQLNDDQATLFKSRAEAFCADRAKHGGPSLPAN